MREALKPALNVMQRLVPQPGKSYGYSKGELKSTLRIKVVKDAPFELKGLVGSKKKKEGFGTWNAGNRAHLSEKGPRTGKRFWRHTPFAEPAETQTKGLIERRLDVGINKILKDDFKNEQ